MSHTHRKSISDADARYVADRLNAMNARRMQRVDQAADFIVALAVAILGILAIIHWATPCAEATLCMAAVITPTRSGPAGALWRTLRRWRTRLALADAELALDRVQADIQHLPAVEQNLQRDIDAMRVELATLQPATKG